MVALGILTGFCLIMAKGCIKPIINKEVAQNVVVSLAAKALGQKMQRNMEWSKQMDQFVSMLESDGVTIKSGNLLMGYVDSNVPALYKPEAMMILEGVGFDIDAGGIVGVGNVDKRLLMTSIYAFKEGLTFRPSPGVVMK